MATTDECLRWQREAEACRRREDRAAGALGQVESDLADLVPSGDPGAEAVRLRKELAKLERKEAALAASFRDKWGDRV